MCVNASFLLHLLRTKYRNSLESEYMYSKHQSIMFDMDPFVDIKVSCTRNQVCCGNG